MSRRQQIEWDKAGGRTPAIRSVAPAPGEACIINAKTQIVATGCNILSTRAPEVGGWLFLGSSTTGIGTHACIPGVGVVQLRRCPLGLDTLIDLVPSEDSTDEEPCFTPYKPIRYPHHRGKRVYTMLVDNAAQVSLVPEKYSHMLTGVRRMAGGVLGVGGMRVPSSGVGYLRIVVEAQENYPSLDFFLNLVFIQRVKSCRERQPAGPARVVAER